MNEPERKKKEQERRSAEGYAPKTPKLLKKIEDAQNKDKEIKDINKPKIVTFQTRLEEFYFLGIENLITDDADWGGFWGNFFGKGGYDKINAHQKDPNCINIWYKKTPETKIYYQGLIVSEADEIPDGYTLTKFPANDYLVATTEWLPTYEETMNHINHGYYENAQIPAGYKKCGETDNKIFLIERWGAKTENGYRYEFWVPIKKEG